MKYRLTLEYRWLVLTEDGLLKPPSDDWGNSHCLSKSYSSREEAIEDYARVVNNGRFSCPNELILVEKHVKGINWDE